MKLQRERRPPVSKAVEVIMGEQPQPFEIIKIEPLVREYLAEYIAQLHECLWEANMNFIYARGLWSLAILAPDQFDQEVVERPHGFSFYGEKLRKEKTLFQIHEAVRILARLFPNTRQQILELFTAETQQLQPYRFADFTGVDIRMAATLLFLAPERADEVRTQARGMAEYLLRKGERNSTRLADIVLLFEDLRPTVQEVAKQSTITRILPDFISRRSASDLFYWLPDVKIIQAGQTRVTPTAEIEFDISRTRASLTSSPRPLPERPVF